MQFSLFRKKTRQRRPATEEFRLVGVYHTDQMLRLSLTDAAMNRFPYENADLLLHISQESTFRELWRAPHFSQNADLSEGETQWKSNTL